MTSSHDKPKHSMIKRGALLVLAVVWLGACKSDMTTTIRPPPNPQSVSVLT